MDNIMDAEIIKRAQNLQKLLHKSGKRNCIYTGTLKKNFQFDKYEDKIQDKSTIEYYAEYYFAPLYCNINYRPVAQEIIAKYQFKFQLRPEIN